MTEIDVEKYEYGNDLVDLEKSPSLRGSFKKGAKDGLQDVAYMMGKNLIRFGPLALLAYVGYRYIKNNQSWLVSGTKKFIKDKAEGRLK